MTFMQRWTLASDALTHLRQVNGFTHAGSGPGKHKPVIWGLRHPDPTLYVWDYEAKRFVLCLRDEWGELAVLTPPWPWLADGTGLDYERSWENT